MSTRFAAIKSVSLSEKEMTSEQENVVPICACETSERTIRPPSACASDALCIAGKKLFNPFRPGACFPNIYPSDVNPKGSLRMIQFFTFDPYSSAQKETKRLNHFR